MGAPPDADRLVRYAQLESVPVALFLESQDHQDDLLRELRLIDIGERFGLTDGPVPSELAALIGDILGHWRHVRSTTRIQAIAAADEGLTEATLLVPLESGITDALRTWFDLLTHADRLCRSGALLTLPARPEVRRLRAWYVEEIVRQAVAA